MIMPLLFVECLEKFLEKKGTCRNHTKLGLYYTSEYSVSCVINVERLENLTWGPSLRLLFRKCSVLGVILVSMPETGWHIAWAMSVHPSWHKIKIVS
jgi:hypothetical protein